MSPPNSDIESLFHTRDTSPVVEDVTMDGPMATEPKLPCIRRDLKCGDCGAPMHIIMHKQYGPFYGCTKFPDCRSTHGAHADGRPMGIPGDKTTREARKKAHQLLDLIWTSKRLSRPQTYAWMRKKMKLTEDEAHIAKFTREQCEKLMAYVREAFPFVRTTWDRLRENPFVDPRTVKKKG